MGKRGHYWCMIVQFLCCSIGYMTETKFLLYWAGAWSLYHAFRYLSFREETEDAVR